MTRRLIPRLCNSLVIRGAGIVSRTQSIPRWFSLIRRVLTLDLTGCGQPRKGVAEKAQDDTVCIKRADLKLIAAALNIDTATMEAAIKSGADVNVAVEGLGPSIVIASLGDNYSGVQLLLDRGANVNAEDSEGHTALKKLIARR